MNNQLTQKVKIKPMQSILCLTCKELLIKVYPWACPQGNVNIACGKCINKANKVKAPLQLKS